MPARSPSSANALAFALSRGLGRARLESQALAEMNAACLTFIRFHFELRGLWRGDCPARARQASMRLFLSHSFAMQSSGFPGGASFFSFPLSSRPPGKWLLSFISLLPTYFGCGAVQIPPGQHLPGATHVGRPLVAEEASFLSPSLSNIACGFEAAACCVNLVCAWDTYLLWCAVPMRSLGRPRAPVGRSNCHDEFEVVWEMNESFAPVILDLLGVPTTAFHFQGLAHLWEALRRPHACAKVQTRMRRSAPAGPRFSGGGVNVRGRRRGRSRRSPPRSSHVSVRNVCQCVLGAGSDVRQSVVVSLERKW